MTKGTTNTAVVSGGSTGIGLEIVRQLLGDGYKVAFFSQHRRNIDAALAELAAVADSDMVHGDVVDLRDVAAVRAFFRTIAKRWGIVSVLVCNAGLSPKGSGGGRTPIEDIDLDEWNEVLGVNLTGTMACCQCTLPGMKSSEFGRIVLIGSLAGRTTPQIAGASYAASKSGLVGLARAIAGEYSRHGVTVNTVCPGRIVTGMTGAPGGPANQAALTRIPIGRLGEPADIARVVTFLARAESDFINGAVIDVNGGEFAPP